MTLYRLFWIVAAVVSTGLLLFRLLWVTTLRLHLSFQVSDETEPVWALRLVVGGLFETALAESNGSTTAASDNPSRTPGRFARAVTSSVKAAAGRWMESVFSPLIPGAGPSVLHVVSQPLPSFLRQIDRLDVRTVIGTGDAALTGGLVGVVHGLENTALAHWTRHLRLNTVPRIHVVADFDQVRFLLEGSCIFRFTFGDIMGATWSWARRWRQLFQA